MTRTTMALMTLVTGCVLVRGSGDLATEQRTVAPFTAVEARDGTEVDLYVDPALEGDVTLEVSTDDNLLSKLITEVRGGTLVVDTEGSLSTRLGLMVTGDVPLLDAVTGRDGAVLSVDHLSGERVDATVSDGAVVRVEGAVGRLVVDASDGGVLEADRLTADTAEVDVRDGAVANVCVTGQVTGTVSDGGVLEVSCGGSTGGVKVSDGGAVRD
jgi:hypothetical protein